MDPNPDPGGTKHVDPADPDQDFGSGTLSFGKQKNFLLAVSFGCCVRYIV